MISTYMSIKSDYQILLFYKYVHIEDPETFAREHKAICEKYGLKGRIIISHEGINATVEGKFDDTENYIKELLKDSRFGNIHWKRSVGTGNAFPKLSCKARVEIVSGHLGVCDIDPNQMTGKRLKPAELHEFIHSGKEFYIVDMRNVYEHNVGHFKNSILPKMENFRDLQKITKDLEHLKNKTVVTVCTGGVRCEKASGYLVSQGFTDVYQLDGGIVSYMEKYPNEDFMGKLYVFDSRITMGFYTDDPKHEIIGRCERCGEKSEHFVNCKTQNCHRHFICCDSCTAKADGSPKCKGICMGRGDHKINSPFVKFINKVIFGVK